MLSDLVAMLQGFFQDLANLTSVSGLNSGIYSFLTASFVLSGLTYIGLPTQSLTAIFGTAAEKGLEDIFLWQLVGTAVSMVVAPIAYTQQVYFTSSTRQLIMRSSCKASCTSLVEVMLILGVAPDSAGL